MPQKGQPSKRCSQVTLSKSGPNTAICTLLFIDPVSRALSAAMMLMRIILALVAILWLGPVAAVTLDIPITAGTDDGEENNAGSVSLTSSDLELVFDRGSNQTVGMRFNNVAIPPGSFVTNAYIQFTVDERSSTATTLTIEGEASDNAVPFIRSTFNISSRLRTSGNVSWSPPPWQTRGETGLNQRTPEISTIIQEIVDRPGWAMDNSLAILITGTGERVVESYNGVPAAAPRLHIEFSGQTGNRSPVVNAGADTSLILPSDTASLDGTVTDDGLPISGNLITDWSHVGGTGSGVVTFGNPNAIDTTATITADPGSYVLRLNVDDGELSTFDEVTISVNAAGMLTLERQITTGTDDGEENNTGSVSLTSSDLELVFDRGSNQTVGMRFNNISIPPGSFVTSAYIQFTVDEQSSAATTLTIEGEASDNAVPFIRSSFNISSRLRTSESVSWSPPPWQSRGETGPDQRTPEIATIIQEIVNRPGWAMDNTLAILITGTGERVVESYNGVPAAAPRLHIEFSGQTSNRSPVVNAGADTSLILPGDTASLDGTVTDDGLPSSGNLITDWSHVGGTGSGVVTFGDLSAIDTTVTISADPGTYVLRLNADDGELSTFDEVTISLREGGEVVALTQVNHFDTGFGSDGNPLTIPSIDPAGIVYHEPFGRLIIADSEINEVPGAWSVVGANLFETSPSGSNLFDQWDLTLITGNEPFRNREPTGIAYCAGDAHFYVTNDDLKLIYRYAYDGSNFTAVDSVSTQPHTSDPEGITCSPTNNRLYVIGGAGINILVYRYDSGFVLEQVLDLVATAGTPAGVPSDPEGIAFDPVSGHLFVISRPDRSIFEYTSSGVFVKKFNIDGLVPRATGPQGLGIGPSSANPLALSIYIADARVDNDQDPNERDGSIYEMEIQRAQ